jgi:prepilin-type N-terminal cleavage/methylation domain-containing protein
MGASYRRGFTIIELLIVIVVIAILAAITIVAFRGIQDKTRTSAVSSALSQAHKKLSAHIVDNPGYPADLATIGITDTSSVSYQYSFNNTANPATYCVTATSGSVSYKVSSASTTPTTGGCAGHGTGGAAAVTNLLTDPSAEGSRSGWLTSSWGTSGAGTTTYPTTGAYHNTSHFRMTWSTASTGGEPYMRTTASSGITAGQTYTCSAYGRTSWAAQVSPRVVFYSGGGTWLTSTNGTLAASGPSWARYSVSSTAPASAVGLYCLYVIQSGSPNAALGATFDIDAAMVTEGSTLFGYADGSSTDWVWNGSPNGSTSTGPAL